MRESKWRGKKVLAIGDSITADGRWQKRFAEIAGCNIETHAYGGLGIIGIMNGILPDGTESVKYDPFTGTGGPFGPLTAEQVKDADLIILLAAYNERHMEYGKRGDMFPRDNTLRGKFAYAIERIYSLIDETGNYDCHIMLVTPHCVGRYDWVNVDGYGEFPEGSGRSLETMAETIKDIAASCNLPCCDAWHTSGINRFTWNYFANSPTPYASDEARAKNTSAPYPEFADQAHLNDLGYARLGECIASAAELA